MNATSIIEPRAYRRSPDVVLDRAIITRRLDEQFPFAIAPAKLAAIFETAASFPSWASNGRRGTIKPDRAHVLTALLAAALPARFRRLDLAVALDMSGAWVSTAISRGRGMLAARSSVDDSPEAPTGEN